MSRPTNKHLLITLVLFVLTIFLFTGCGKDETKEKTAIKSKKLYVYNWSYYTPESLIVAFEKKYGVDVVLDYYASSEEMFAKLKASGNAGYDIIFPSGDYVSIMMHEGMLEKIDPTKIPNLEYITALAIEKATYDPKMEYSVPYYLGASGIAVNKKMVKEYEKTWNIFSNKKFADRMVMMDDMREVMGDALAYLGYSVNTTNAKELEEARVLVNSKWKPNLVKFDAEGFAKGFASGDYWVSHGYAEAIFEELPEEKWDNVDFFLPPDGGPMYIDSMCIPKGARNYDLALLFINFIHEPENYAQFLDRFHFPASVNSAAEEFTTTKPFYTVDMLKNYELKDDLGANLDMYNKAWESIRYVN